MANKRYKLPDNWQELETQRLFELSELERKRTALRKKIQELKKKPQTPETSATLDVLLADRENLNKLISRNRKQSVWQRKANSNKKAEYMLDPEKREKARRAGAEWRKSPKGKQYMKDYRKEWYKKNSHLAIRTVTRRRARKRSNGFEYYSLEEAIALYGTKCHICAKDIDLNSPRKIGADGWQESLQLDHIIPISKGGPDILDNVRPAHARCNMTRQIKDL